MRTRCYTATAVFALLSYSLCFSQSSEPVTDSVQAPMQIVVAAPTSVLAEDMNYDVGNRIRLTWVPSIDDQPMDSRVTGYKIYRYANGSDSAVTANVPAGVATYVDEGLNRESSYTYVVATLSSNAEFPSIRTQAITPEREWINFDRTSLFIIALILGGAIIYFIESARKGKKLFVRKIAGLEAIDDAIGRATEMGRPILFVPGIQDMNEVETVAGLTILGRVARVVADYDTKIFVPTSRSLVMTAARETIKSAYQTAGRADAYSDEMSSYITDEQFGYVAAVNGRMMREKPATCFYMGVFFAESLMLAETGHSVGAIQIAGTARPIQIPFFVAACDFTLIGEELFAASAYLSGEPKQLGSLKGQDVGKAVALVIITVGTIAVTATTLWDVPWLKTFLHNLTSVFSSR